MTYTPYIWPQLAAALLTAGAATRARRFREAPAVRPFRWLMWLSASWALMDALQMLAAPFALKVALFNAQRAATVFLPFCVVCVALEYLDPRAWLTPRRLAWLLPPPLLVVILIVTSRYHALWGDDYRLTTQGALTVVQYRVGIGQRCCAAVSFIEIAASLGLLLASFRSRKASARETALLCLAIFIPFLVQTLFAFGATPIRGYNFTPIALALTGGLYLWAFRRFNVTPIARNLALDALRASEQQLRLIVEMSPMPLLLSRLTGKILLANQSFCAVFGYARDEIGSHETSELYANPEQDRTRILALLRQEGRIVQQEVAARKADGSRLDVLLSGEIISYAGQPAIIAVLYDLTERKRVEASLAQEKRQLDDIIKGTNVGTWEWNVQTGEIVFNERWAEIIGRTLAEIAPTTIETWKALAHPDDLKKSGELLARHFQGALDYYECELRMRHKNGKWVWVLDRGKVAAFTPDGKPLLMSGTHQDIDAHKQAEEALQKNEERLRLLLDSTAEAIYGIDLNGNCTFNNPACLRLLGYRHSDDLLGKNMHWLIHYAYADGTHFPVEKCRIFQAFQIGEGSHVADEVLWRADGTSFPAEYWSYPQRRDGAIIGAVVTFIDITARKQAEEALRRAKQAAEDANRAKSTFLAHMSHELRTPLNGILGYAQILLRGEPLTAKQRDGLAVIERSGNYLLDLINDILDLAKVEAGKVELALADLRLFDLLDGIGDITRVKTDAKQIAFRLEAAPTLPPVIRADERRLRQILLNLLGNAVKFTEHGGVTLRVIALPANTHDASQNGQTAQEEKIMRLRFEVEDTGVGLKAVDIEHLFDPFMQVGDARYKMQGTGLGLTISRNLVQLMGGELQVTSEFGVGSRFWFELPAFAAASAALAAPQEARRIIGIKGAPPRLLAVDDDPANRRVIVDALVPLGFDVREANDGREGWRRCLELRPQAVITDLRMPNMDGLTLIRQLRQTPEFADVVIFASSASVYQEDQQECVAAGAQMFLPKPLDISILLQQLQHGLHLTWRYAAAAEPNAPTPPCADVTPERMAALPEEIRARLKEIAIVADMGEVDRIIAEIRMIDAGLADALAELAQNFEYGKILALL